MNNLSVTLTHKGEVATLTITSKKGTMGPAFWQQVPLALANLGNARVLIIRGEELFSAGLDIKASAEQIAPALGNQAAFKAIVDEMHTVLEGIARLPIPVIAAVHGWCIGAGLELISGADIRLCSQDARFSLPEVKLGITADLGGLQRLPYLIGRGRTSYLALTGDTINAQKAEQWGLVTEVLDSAEALFERAEALALQLTQLPAKALEGTKHILSDGLPHGQSMANAATWNAQHMSKEALLSAFKRG